MEIISFLLNNLICLLLVYLQKGHWYLMNICFCSTNNKDVREDNLLQHAIHMYLLHS